MNKTLITCILMISPMLAMVQSNINDLSRIDPMWLEEHQIVIATQCFEPRKSLQLSNETYLYVIEFINSPENINTVPKLRLAVKALAKFAQTSKENFQIVSYLIK